MAINAETKEALRAAGGLLAAVHQRRKGDAHELVASLDDTERAKVIEILATMVTRSMVVLGADPCLAPVTIEAMFADYDGDGGGRWW